MKELTCYLRGLYEILSNNYNGTFLRKQLVAVTYLAVKYFHKKLHNKMFDMVLNMSVLHINVISTNTCFMSQCSCQSCLNEKDATVEKDLFMKLESSGTRVFFQSSSSSFQTLYPDFITILQNSH